MTGYELANLSETLSKVKVAGVAVLVGLYKADVRNAPWCDFLAAISPRSTRSSTNKIRMQQFVARPRKSASTDLK